MKKTILSKLPVLGLLLAGMFLLTTQGSVQAQSTTIAQPQNSLFQPPVGPFVSPSLATTILTGQLEILKAELGGLTAGTEAFRLKYGKYIFYEEMISQLSHGVSVSNAIVAGLQVISRDEYALSHQTLLEYRQEAINLLKL